MAQKKFRKKDAERVKKEKDFQQIEKLHQRIGFLIGIIEGTLVAEDITIENINEAFGGDIDIEAFASNPAEEAYKKFMELNKEESDISLKYLTKEQLIELSNPESKMGEKALKFQTKEQLIKSYKDKLEDS